MAHGRGREHSRRGRVRGRLRGRRVAPRLVSDCRSVAALEYHRWLGVTAAIAAIIAALTIGEMDDRPSRQWRYRVALFSAAALVAVAGHFGAVLVWGADFLRSR